MPFGAPNLIAGIGTLTVDGNQMALRSNLQVMPDAAEREGLAGMDGVHGYRETPKVPFIECDISLSSLSAVTDLLETVIGASTVVAEFADGRTFQLNQAWYRGNSEVSGTDGLWRARFEGISCTEILAAIA
jgi:hypothetical protein